MASLSLREAAKQVGVSRQTVYRLVKQGKLSATVDHAGQKMVDTSELLRVFGSLPATPATPPETVSVTVSRDSIRQVETQPATGQPGPSPGLQAMTAAERRREVEAADRAALQAELQAAREALRKAEEQLEEAKVREAKLLDLATAQTRLLEHREVPRGFWRRLFGK